MKNQYYSNPHFHRAPERRNLADALSDNDALIISNKEKFLFSKTDGTVELAFFPLKLFKSLLRDVAFLGRTEGKNLWTCELCESDLAEVQGLLEVGEFLPVRNQVNLLNNEHAALLSYAMGINKWHKISQYCGACGTDTKIQENGHSRRCKNPECAITFYPQISPAVIVLIEYRPQNGEPLCLLSKKEMNSGLMCSTFAGFVEVGESLEDAVVREMKEEVSVEVSNIRYLASQPWPFSSALMVGFIAETRSTVFQVDGDEIIAADWFSAQQLRKLVVEKQIMLSKPDSIARFMIESWINDNERQS